MNEAVAIAELTKYGCRLTIPGGVFSARLCAVSSLDGNQSAECCYWVRFIVVVGVASSPLRGKMESFRGLLALGSRNGREDVLPPS